MNYKYFLFVNDCLLKSNLKEAEPDTSEERRICDEEKCIFMRIEEVVINNGQ